MSSGSNEIPQTPRVSVCIPTYNGRKDLKECLDSVSAQTFKDLEVVICDDQSSDGTLEFARELALGDRRFRFIQNPKRFGLVGNWNNCIAMARGQWIKFVFQDDIIDPTCVEKLLLACEQTGASFAFCARDFIFETGINPMMLEWLPGHQKVLDAMYRGQTVITSESVVITAVQRPEHNIVGEPTVTLIRKSVFDRFGFFDDALIQLCDTEFWFRIMSNLGGVWVPERLAKFRIHASATTTTNLSGRVFRSTVLDPLVVRYRLAYDHNYSRLRKTKLPGKYSIGFVLRLKLRCGLAAYHAWQKASRPGPNGHARDLVKEWKTVTTCYPQISSLIGLGRGMAVLQTIKKCVKRLASRKCSSESK